MRHLLSAGRRNAALVCAAALTGLIYYFSNPNGDSPFDYTFRIAQALLQGELGLREKPGSWLNEMVPHEGRWYSVFPLGSVLTFIPFAALARAGLIYHCPTRLAAALAAAGILVFAVLLSRAYAFRTSQRLLLAIFLLFGTWSWCNTVFGGAWQLALAVAMLAELAALYFTLVSFRPFWAGFCFAAAFGNRTEILATAPLFLLILLHRAAERSAAHAARTTMLRTACSFCLAPFVLGAATLLYNDARFGSPFDFGYARIPGVLDEPWYRQGIFSFAAIKGNFRAMVTAPWRVYDHYPYLVPDPFGSSIFLTSPYLLALFTGRAANRLRWAAAWAAIIVLTTILWCHGNPGGWQHSYRYAMVLLPWAYIILLENKKCAAGAVAVTLIALSVAANAWATYLFYWTKHVTV